MLLEVVSLGIWEETGIFLFGLRSLVGLQGCFGVCPAVKLVAGS